MARLARGRRKLELRRIEKKKKLQATFSRRRKDLFKKASELSVMCGAEAAIFVSSPSRKVFSFGNPSVEEVADRFLTGQVHHRTGTSQLVDMYKELTMVNDQLKLEKKRGEDLGHRVMALEEPAEELNDIDQLEQLKASLEEIKINVKEAENQLVAHQNANLVASFAKLQLEKGSGSSTSDFG